MKTSPHIDQEYKRLNLILLALIVLAMLAIAYLFWGKYQAAGPGSGPETTSLVQESNQTSQESQEVTSATSIETSTSQETTSQETTTQEEKRNLEELTDLVILDLPPVGTSQSGYHITDYSDGSLDRQEIRQAYQAAMEPYSDLESLTETWIGYISPTETSATITDNKTGKTYLILMEWVDGEGWKPTSISPQ